MNLAKLLVVFSIAAGGLAEPCRKARQSISASKGEGSSIVAAARYDAGALLSSAVQQSHRCFKLLNDTVLH
jgi:hypothetical protein